MLVLLVYEVNTKRKKPQYIVVSEARQISGFTNIGAGITRTNVILPHFGGRQTKSALVSAHLRHDCVFFRRSFLVTGQIAVLHEDHVDALQHEARVSVLPAPFFLLAPLRTPKISGNLERISSRCFDLLL